MACTRYRHYSDLSQAAGWCKPSCFLVFGTIWLQITLNPRILVSSAGDIYQFIEENTFICELSENSARKFLSHQEASAKNCGKMCGKVEITGKACAWDELLKKVHCLKVPTLCMRDFRVLYSGDYILERVAEAAKKARAHHEDHHSSNEQQRSSATETKQSPAKPKKTNKKKTTAEHQTNKNDHKLIVVSKVKPSRESSTSAPIKTTRKTPLSRSSSGSKVEPSPPHDNPKPSRAPPFGITKEPRLSSNKNRPKTPSLSPNATNKKSTQSPTHKPAQSAKLKKNKSHSSRTGTTNAKLHRKEKNRSHRLKFSRESGEGEDALTSLEESFLEFRS